MVFMRLLPLFNGDGFLKNIRLVNGISYHSKALLFYKLPRIRPQFMIRHTNEKEIILFILNLNKLGFSVDVLDRNFWNHNLKSRYDLFLGLGTSGSGVRFLEVAQNSKADLRILIATTPHPVAANKNRRLHFRYLEDKYGVSTISPDRLDPTESLIGDHLSASQSVLVYGTPESFSVQSFSKTGARIAAYGPSSIADNDWSNPSIVGSNYVLFSGSGLLAKGADLLVDAFLELPDLNLNIFAPPEESFLKIFQQRIAKSNSVSYMGFLPPTKSNLLNLRKRSIASVFCSPSEAFASSISSLMHFGLIPVINYESGMDIDSAILGEFKDVTTEKIKDKILAFHSLSSQEKQKLSDETYQKGKLYSSRHFSDLLLSQLSHLIYGKN